MSKYGEINLAEFENKIHELALADFELFCKMAGINKRQLYVCFSLAKGLSLGQIGLKLKVGKSTVYAIAQKCPDKSVQNLQTVISKK
jgi:DNA-binding NarL/FixJ family response regulator